MGEFTIPDAFTPDLIKSENLKTYNNFMYNLSLYEEFGSLKEYCVKTGFLYCDTRKERDEVISSLLNQSDGDFDKARQLLRWMYLDIDSEEE